MSVMTVFAFIRSRPCSKLFYENGQIQGGLSIHFRVVPLLTYSSHKITLFFLFDQLIFLIDQFILNCFRNKGREHYCCLFEHDLTNQYPLSDRQLKNLRAVFGRGVKKRIGRRLAGNPVDFVNTLAGDFWVSLHMVW